VGPGYPARVGLIGCGNISKAYLTSGYGQFAFTACADLDVNRATTTAASYGLEPMTVGDLLADPSIDVVCNLTVPQAHVEVSLAAAQAGKHAYQEKPLGLDREGPACLLAITKQKGLRLGCAPDTFLGAGLQTCRRVIDGGAIGTPVAAMANMVIHGHEHWHPDPAFYYLKGGGPLLDMGPYYLTALVTLLGPVTRVAALSPEISGVRTVRSGL
jgi:predicted dehydrogenase